MTYIHHLFLVIVLMLGALPSFGQLFSPPIISIASQPTGIPSSGILGDTVVYTVIFQNLSDSISYNGVIDLGVQVDSQPAFYLPGGVHSLDTMGTTSSAIYTDTVIQARYGSGDGVVVVVIWPVAKFINGLGQQDTAIIADSVSASMEILWAASLSNWDAEFQLYCFPNPTQSYVYVEYGELKREVGQVRLMDVNGRELYRYEGAAREIVLEDLDVGMYWLVIEGKEGQRSVFRVIKK